MRCLVVNMPICGGRREKAIERFGKFGVELEVFDASTPEQCPFSEAYKQIVWRSGGRSKRYRTLRGAANGYSVTGAALEATKDGGPGLVIEDDAFPLENFDLDYLESILPDDLGMLQLQSQTPMRNDWDKARYEYPGGGVVRSTVPCGGSYATVYSREFALGMRELWETSPFGMDVVASRYGWKVGGSGFYMLEEPMCGHDWGFPSMRIGKNMSGPIGAHTAGEKLFRLIVEHRMARPPVGWGFIRRARALGKRGQQIAMPQVGQGPTPQRAGTTRDQERIARIARRRARRQRRARR